MSASDGDEPTAADDAQEQGSYVDRRAKARKYGKEKGELYRSYMYTSVSGMEIGVAIGLGALIGWWLDRKYGWRPWGMVGGLMLGMGHAAKILVKLSRKAMLEDEQSPSEDTSDDEPSAPEPPRSR